jgi:D-alanine-D-alanine ligase
MISDTKILICYNAPVSIFSVYNGKPVGDKNPLNDLSEKGFKKEISRIRESLKKYYSSVRALAIDRDVQKTIKKITAYKPDAIFNFVESVEGIASYEYCMAGLFELLGYQYTGNIPSCLGNCLNKSRTKNILRSLGISTPSSITVKKSEKVTAKNIKLTYPLILKLLNEDASIGISEFSVVKDFRSLNKHLNFLQKTYKQDVIIEEYIEGRELNVAVLGRTVLPVSEIIFKGLPDKLPKIVTYDGKWMQDSLYFKYTNPKCPARLNKRLLKKVEEIALAAFDAMNCRDYARVDLRLDKNNKPFVIEVNPNPDISMDSGFARAAKASGIEYPELLFRISQLALLRKKSDTQVKAG